MTGKVERVPQKNGTYNSFAFIKGDDKKDYFLHKQDLTDDWDDLISMVLAEGGVKIQFEPKESPKGPRASNASIVDE